MTDGYGIIELVTEFDLPKSARFRYITDERIGIHVRVEFRHRDPSMIIDEVEKTAKALEAAAAKLRDELPSWRAVDAEDRIRKLDELSGSWDPGDLDL